MYNKILIATDGSVLAQKAVSDGLELARELNASVIFVTVTEIWSTLSTAAEQSTDMINPTESYGVIQAAWAHNVLDAATDMARKVGIVSETVHKKDHPANGIIEVAKNNGCDLIVMASHGRRGVKRVLLGSVAYEVTTHSPVPVLVIR